MCPRLAHAESPEPFTVFLELVPVQAVDPSDPLVQQLVQDKMFLQAVQTSQLHVAATAAVRLLRVGPTPGCQVWLRGLLCCRAATACSPPSPWSYAAQ